ncbi:alpha/beta hydrolase [Candidatus Albibeggiatoa sp. nov. BB20]|uniref:alpha/beta hydrolase n=1 Tax=Candidatus Albibeggiatoa sp. nov. BB20 TaxID=3162723 RepID=UPI00336574F3
MLLTWQKLRWVTGLAGLSLSLIGNTALALDPPQTAPLHVNGITNYSAASSAAGLCVRKMYVYSKLGAASSGNYKPVMLLHAGGWVDGPEQQATANLSNGPTVLADVGTGKTLTQELVDRGYVVFIPYYRLINNTNDPNTTCRSSSITAEDIEKDVKDALIWAHSHRLTYSAQNHAKVRVMGFSAGAHLALSLAFSSAVQSIIERVVSFAPPSNFTDLTDPAYYTYLQNLGHPTVNGQIYFNAFAYTGGSSATQIARINRNSFHDLIANNPSLRNSLPPIGFLHGFQDATVPVQQSVDLCLKLGGYTSIPQAPVASSNDYAVLVSCGSSNKFFFDYHHYLDHGAQCQNIPSPLTCTGAQNQFNNSMQTTLNWLN